MTRTHLALALAALPTFTSSQEPVSCKVVATNKTSTMQKETQEGGDAGFRFAAVMGGQTAFGGKEVVAAMQKPTTSHVKYDYRLLATNKTSTMEKELKEAGEASFHIVDMTVGKTLVVMPGYPVCRSLT